MTNPFQRLSPRGRVSMIIWALNITLCFALLFFVLR